MTTAQVARERWKSSIEGVISVRRFDTRGVLRHVVVDAGKVIELTPEERRINEEEVADQALNPFRNGMLTPVSLVDEEFDNDDIASNPQNISAVEIEELFDTKKTPWQTFGRRVGEIDNPYTLKRLMDYAKVNDVTVKQMNVVTERLKEVAPPGFVEVETIQVGDDATLAGSPAGNGFDRRDDDPRHIRARPVTPGG